MIALVKNFIKYCKSQERRKIAIKRYIINQHIIRMYEDLQNSTGEYNAIPACLLAKKAMEENCKTDKDVNRLYRKLELAKAV